MDTNLILEKLRSIGLTDNKAEETIKNQNLTVELCAIIDLAKTYRQFPIPKPMGNILYKIATTMKPQIKHMKNFVIKYVSHAQIDSENKLKCALDYLLNNPMEPIDVPAFERAIGIGISFSDDEISKNIDIALEKSREELLTKRYNYNTGPLFGSIMNSLKFADAKKVKAEFERKLLEILGEKTESDLQKPVKAQRIKTKKDATNNGNQVASVGPVTIGELMQKLDFHKPGENYKADNYVITPNTMNLLKEHLEKTYGQVRTRFPPEPNGILHIGHAKAININFGYAKAHYGICFLRFDDTNPEKEDDKFFCSIHEMVEWLGYEPSYITHSSDYFDQLYEYAHQLIARGKAYVCHQKSEEIKDMAKGKFAEGEATLRMKVTLEEGKQDPVAYRIKYVPHPRTGNKWCIYPTYDFTHCLCDSLENITHSLCTKEFQSRRSSYYWLCNALDIYCPVQWEYGRLNLNYTVVSKRKIGKLIETGHIQDWDDPRLFTLPALRRRGFPPEAINNFCAQMGVTGAQTTVDPEMLEAVVRDTLNVSAPRFMAVLEPLKVIITNMPQLEMKVTVPLLPFDSTKGSYSTVLYPTLYIEASDYRNQADSGFYRLTSSQSVGLRHAGLVIHFTKEIRTEDGHLEAIQVTCSKVDDCKKPKAFIHWVSNPHMCEVRLYNRLFLHKNPEDTEEVPDGYLSDINPESITLLPNAMVVKAVASLMPFKTLQFERIGYFCVDPDSTPSRMVFNRTCNLKEDSRKE
ncbi:QARS [Cordylochernes scorpioides]|uniref:glutamine--tRNA ligase n=1 Tax=Cordylochernes scorpioides TaxID=51811 RepID=A0ABY6JWW1_9ARAC|nr:QARS [Cordylochernes scorpioides]